MQQNNIELLKSTIKLLQKTIESNLDFVMYDCSAFDAAWKTASDILATHTSMSSIIPRSPPPLLSTINNLVPVSNLLNLIHLPGAANLADFYPWLSTILNGFNLTLAEDVVKVALTLQAIPLAIALPSPSL